MSSEEGLFQAPPKQGGGRALVANEEKGGFFDLLHQKQMMGTGEWQLFCKLYDASRWISSTGMYNSDDSVLQS